MDGGEMKLKKEWSKEVKFVRERERLSENGRFE